MRNTLLADCLEIAFTSKGGFCIPAVIGAVSLGSPESISIRLCAVKCGPSLVYGTEDSNPHKHADAYLAPSRN